MRSKFARRFCNFFIEVYAITFTKYKLNCVCRSICTVCMHCMCMWTKTINNYTNNGKHNY